MSTPTPAEVLADVVAAALRDYDRGSWDGSQIPALRTALFEYRDRTEAATAAYRAEVIAARDEQIITWLEKKAREEGSSNKDSRVRATAIYRMADKLSRGAVRPPLSGAPTPAQESYPGELVMFRGLLGVLRVTAQHGDMAEVRRLLTEHASDEQAAFPGACEACGDTDAQWCPDCAACRKGCHGGHDDNDCTHPRAPWRVAS
jgi:hypothetical protein